MLLNSYVTWEQISRIKALQITNVFSKNVNLKVISKCYFFLIKHLMLVYPHHSWIILFSVHVPSGYGI